MSDIGFKPESVQYDDETTIAFVGTANSNCQGKHEHDFRPLTSNAYFKVNSRDVSYIVLFCPCGETKEVIAEDFRANNFGCHVREK